MKAKIHVTLKNGVLDPQGSAILSALNNLEINGVDQVRQGKYFELDISEADQEKAKKLVDEACKTLLANTVIEDYSFELVA